MEILLVSPVPDIAPRGTKQEVRGALHPLVLREAIVGGREREVFPFLDSRTRYWRYMFLEGPRKRKDLVLGRHLLRIVAKNSSGSARRGIGRNTYNDQLFSGRKVSKKKIRAVAQAFRLQYGAAAKRFWKYAKRDSAVSSLREMASFVIQGRYDPCFFEEHSLDRKDGQVRRIFRRILRRQSKSAREFAKVLKRKRVGYEVREAISTLKASTLKLDETKRITLAWALLRCLYRSEELDLSLEQARDSAPTSEPAEDVLAALAQVSLRELEEGTAPELATPVRKMLTGYLESALSSKHYTPPLAPPTIPGNQERQILFPDLRLSAFARLLQQTAPIS